MIKMRAPVEGFTFLAEAEGRVLLVAKATENNLWYALGLDSDEDDVSIWGDKVNGQGIYWRPKKSTTPD